MYDDCVAFVDYEVQEQYGRSPSLNLKSDRCRDRYFLLVRLVAVLEFAKTKTQLIVTPSKATPFDTIRAKGIDFHQKRVLSIKNYEALVPDH